MKFLYGYFHPETGESKVVLANKSGTFIGKARLHPEDKEHASEYAGCRLAEGRAWIEYYKKEKKRSQEQINTIKNLYKDIYRNCSKTTAKEVEQRFKIQLKYYEEKLKESKEIIKEIKKQLEDSIKVRDEITKRSKD